MNPRTTTPLLGATVVLAALALPASAFYGASSTFKFDGENPHSAVVADINADGIDDIAAVFPLLDKITGAVIGSRINFLVGDGLGGMKVETTVSLDFDVRSMATGDFDGDAQPDLAVAQQKAVGEVDSYCGEDEGIVVFFGAHDEVQPTLEFANCETSVLAGMLTTLDADGDGLEAERDRLAVGIMRGFVPPLLVGLAITVLATVVHVRHARRPLSELATALEKRDPDSLEPLTLVRPAREIVPIAAALNHLIVALRDRIGRERRFIADAAHELRTPLASIQTDADVALELDGEPRREALLGLRAGASRAARLVGQLMTLARLEPLSTIAEQTPFDLGACVESVMAQLAPSASEKQTTISLEERAPAELRGQRALVEVLVRNLVENAIRYTPSRGQVRVFTDSVPGALVLQVEDSGPGIPRENRERVFERFYRGTQGTGPGSGLGLSISARIATLHGAEIELGDSPLGGLTATVSFPSGSEPASLEDARTREPAS